MTTNEEIKHTEETINETEMTMDQLIAQQESLSEKLYKKEIVEVPVVQINQDYILVDVGAKKEAAIAISEFEGKAMPSVGDTISAVLVPLALYQAGQARDRRLFRVLHSSGHDDRVRAASGHGYHGAYRHHHS